MARDLLGRDWYILLWDETETLVCLETVSKPRRFDQDHMLQTTSSAWHKYQLDLEQKKKNAMKDTVTRKRKAFDDKIQSLKRSTVVTVDLGNFVCLRQFVSELGAHMGRMEISKTHNRAYTVYIQCL